MNIIKFRNFILAFIIIPAFLPLFSATAQKTPPVSIWELPFKPVSEKGIFLKNKGQGESLAPVPVVFGKNTSILPVNLAIKPLDPAIFLKILDSLPYHPDRIKWDPNDVSNIYLKDGFTIQGAPSGIPGDQVFENVLYLSDRLPKTIKLDTDMDIGTSKSTMTLKMLPPIKKGNPTTGNANSYDNKQSRRDYVIKVNLNPNEKHNISWLVMAHEMMHCAVDRCYLYAPLWIDEGIASFADRYHKNNTIYARGMHDLAQDGVPRGDKFRRFLSSPADYPHRHMLGHLLTMYLQPRARTGKEANNGLDALIGFGFEVQDALFNNEQKKADEASVRYYGVTLSTLEKGFIEWLRKHHPELFKQN